MIGRAPPGRELPRFEEPVLELWVDPASWTMSTVGPATTTDDPEAREVLQRLGQLERCVRTRGGGPSEGALAARTGPYGSWVRLEAGPPLQARLDCLDQVPELWQGTAFLGRIEATVRVTGPGGGPEGWWRPSVEAVPPGRPVRSETP
jgi:hypothetical protein